MSKLQTQNWMAKQISLDTGMVPNDAPWLEIIYFRATTWIHALDSEQSSKNCIFRETIFKQLQQLDEARFSLVLCYKVLLFETRKNSQSLQAIRIHSLVMRAPVRELSPRRGRKLLLIPRIWYFFENVVIMSKLQTQNWMATQIFLHTGTVLNDAPWLEIIYFRATT